MDAAAAKEYGDARASSPTSHDKQSDYSNAHDAEPLPDSGSVKPVELKRKLQSRHIQMIAIGGTIGTGLFIVSCSFPDAASERMCRPRAGLDPPHFTCD